MSRKGRIARRALATALLLGLASPVALAVAPPQDAGVEPARPAPPRATRRRPPVVPVEPEEEARPFFEEHLPEPLLRVGPRGLLWWQWLALPIVVLVAILAGSLLGLVTRRLLGHLAARTRTQWDDVLLARIAGPLTAMWAIAVTTAIEPLLAFHEAAGDVLHHALRAATYLVLFWAGFRAVDVAYAAVQAAPWTKVNAGLAGMLPLGRKVAKVVLLALGLVAVMNELGFQVASLLAGLGIGGIALALAAQKTVENLFGSVSIGVDQPFRVGDFVKVEDFTGTVETIGMRSTRFRTLDRTLVTVPNGKLAEMRTETFAARDRIRLYANLGLSYGTTAAQMRAVISGIEALLRAHPKLWPDGPYVRFTDLKDSTLNVEVVAWFGTTDWAEFTALRQELLLGFMEVVERAGTSFAFPTRTVQLVRGRDGGEAADGAGRR